MKKIVILSLSVILFFIFSLFAVATVLKNKKANYESFSVKKMELTEEVNITGKIKPSHSVDLAFEKSGRVERVDVKVGDLVRAGKALMVLDDSDLLAQLAQAEANIKMQRAKLSELKIGAKPEEVKIEEIKVSNAESAFVDAQRNLIDKLQDAYTKSDDGIRNKLDQIFDDPRTVNPQILFSVSEWQLEIDIKSERIETEELLKSWKNSLDSLSTASDFNIFIVTAKSNLTRIKSLLDKSALAVNGAVSGPSLTQTTIDSWKSDISTARTNLNTAVVNLSAAEENLRNAESAVVLAEQELVLKKSGATTDQIVAQEALVEEAEANALNTRAQILKATLTAPIDGVVTRLDMKKGEIAVPNEPVLSIISTSKFEVEANIPEADIGKIKVNNEAKITLDAYGDDEVFEAIVVAIDPAETLIGSIPTYKTTLQFIKEDERIRSGMTANLKIVSFQKQSVLAVPQKAIFIKNKEKFVKKIENQKISDVNIKTGLVINGNVEVTYGLKQGDQILVEKEK